ncbi:unnamed protein product [Peniophora sp. CBMAI 1063]|nr:unnamed protein product [Peniophora sp. CBMAI 1063]
MARSTTSLNAPHGSTRSKNSSSDRASSTKYWSRRRILPVKREVWQQLVAKRPSFLILDERLRGPSAPTLHFGLTYTKDDIMRCALKCDLIPTTLHEVRDDAQDEARRIYLVIAAVREYFERTLRLQLFHVAAFIPGQLGMFALYSNHTIRKLHRRKAERPILNFMRQELGIEQQMAAWYWDIQHGSSYVCEYDEFNL